MATHASGVLPFGRRYFHAQASVREHLKDPLLWLRGLLSAFITGGASAVLGGTGWAAAHGLGMDVPAVNWKVMGIIFVSAGVPGAAAFLMRSPLPEVVTVSETTITEKVVTTTTPQKVVDAPSEKA